MKAKRPLILAGGGVICSDATEQLRQFAEHVNVPVYSTFMGKGALSARHPLHLGIAGCWGEYPASEAAKNADVILAIGCRFSDIHCSSWVPGYTYNIPPTRLIHVDLDPQEIGRNYPTELGIVGDAREVLKQLHRARRPRAEARALALERPGRGAGRRSGRTSSSRRRRRNETPDRPAARDLASCARRRRTTR